MATKPFVTVSLILHDADSPVELADYINDDGQFVNLGTQTAAAIARREAVHSNDNNGSEVIIPFHAISAVTVSKKSGEYTKPDDDFCQPLCPEEGCNVSFTVTWMDGEVVLGTQVYGSGETPLYNGATPTKEGYTFLGWNTNPEAQTALETLPPVDDTTTYYAIWEQEQGEP